MRNNIACDAGILTILGRAAAGVRIACVLVLMFPACVWAASEPVEESAADQDSVKAILKPQEIAFYYQSFTSFYSCDGLSGKIKRILRALGAQKETKVRTSGCSGASGQIIRSPLVTITMVSPVEATPQAIADMDKTRTQRELTARVRGERALGTEAADQFDAHWKPVSLSRGSLGLDPGDCELIDELRRKVLPKMGVRIIKDSVQCTPNQVNRAQPRLEVEALVQPPPDEQQQTPDAAADEPEAAIQSEAKAAEPAMEVTQPVKPEPM